jgi:hypothetical protein
MLGQSDRLKLNSCRPQSLLLDRICIRSRGAVVNVAHCVLRERKYATQRNRCSKFRREVRVCRTVAKRRLELGVGGLICAPERRPLDWVFSPKSEKVVGEIAWYAVGSLQLVRKCNPLMSRR